MFKEDALANLLLLLAPIAIGLLMGILVPGALRNPGGYARLALILYGIGFVSFAAAKIQNIRKGHLLSSGTSLMSPPAKWAYRIGYAFMMLGFFLTLAILVASKWNV